jgi:hypothetical protein
LPESDMNALAYVVAGIWQKSVHRLNKIRALLNTVPRSAAAVMKPSYCVVAYLVVAIRLGVAAPEKGNRPVNRRWPSTLTLLALI